MSNPILTLPQKYPFLMIDRVQEVELPNRIVALKNVSINEPYFVGHFPDNPIMPGVLITEAIAQTASVLMNLNQQEQSQKGLFLLGVIKKMSFKRPVVPGDQLVIEIIADKILSTSAVVGATATVEGEVAATGTLLFSKKEDNE